MVEKLHEVFREVAGSLTPIPPPLRIVEDGKAPSFAVDLSKMLVAAPPFWNEMEHLKEILAHEVKHGSGDGMPYTYRNALRFEAETMKELGVPLETARALLNIVYDVVVDLKVAKEGLDAKGMNGEWLKRFPVTREAEGTSYHLLQIIYKDLFKTPLKETDYEREVRANSDYTELKRILKQLTAECEKYGEERSVDKVVEAVAIISRLSKLETPPSQGKGSDVWFDRGAPSVRADAAEIGLEAGLEDGQLAELMGVGVEELEDALERAAEDKTREALWGKILSFKDLSTTLSFYELKEPVSVRWKPYSRELEPTSVIKNPGDPRKWKTTVKQTVLTVEQEGEAGGFSDVIILADCSGSTASTFENRPVLGYIKDVAYGLIAYAKRFGLPVVVVAFQSHAWLLTPKSRNYVEHAKRVFLLRSDGSTNLGDAVCKAIKLRPVKALIALITDGLVDEGDLKRLADHSEVNRVIAAVVDASEEGVETVKTVSDKVQLYVVKPDSAGRTAVSILRG